MDKQECLVAISCITYNHKDYLRDCLEGFMMQKTNFRFVAVVHDDCSTDGTTDILREYAAKYSDIIWPIYEDENQYSKHNGEIDRKMNEAFDQLGAKYIALCEGDDYWIDPLKLQKQVNFLEEHEGYSVCFTRCMRHDVEQDVFSEDESGFLFTDESKGVDVDHALFFSKWVTQPLTLVYRKSAFSTSYARNYKLYRDMHMIYHLLKNGKGYIMPDVTGVYNLHSGGIFGKVSLKNACVTEYNIARELYEVNRDAATKTFLENVTQWCINEHKNNDMNKWQLSFELFALNHRVKRLVKNIFNK